MQQQIPDYVGPCQFGQPGAMIAIKCPHEFNGVMLKAGGQWEPGSKRWLIERRRICPVIRRLERTVDPLFRRAGVMLD